MNFTILTIQNAFQNGTKSKANKLFNRKIYFDGKLLVESDEFSNVHCKPSKEAKEWAKSLTSHLQLQEQDLDALFVWLKAAGIRAKYF